MITDKERHGLRLWLRNRGIQNPTDSDVDKFVKSTRIQMYLWALVIVGLFAAAGAVLWHALR